MWFTLFIFIQSWVSGYRDMARFWQEGTWPLWNKAKWLPYWEVEGNKKTDPFHSAGGLMWALNFAGFLILAFVWYWTGDFIAWPFYFWFSEWYLAALTLLFHGLWYWMFFYWMRNTLMHYFGVVKEWQNAKYLWPPPIRWFMKRKG